MRGEMYDAFRSLRMRNSVKFDAIEIPIVARGEFLFPPAVACIPKPLRDGYLLGANLAPVWPGTREINTLRGEMFCTTTHVHGIKLAGVYSFLAGRCLLVLAMPQLGTLMCDVKAGSAYCLSFFSASRPLDEWGKPAGHMRHV